MRLDEEKIKKLMSNLLIEHSDVCKNTLEHFLPYNPEVGYDAGIFMEIEHNNFIPETKNEVINEMNALIEDLNKEIKNSGYIASIWGMQRNKTKIKILPVKKEKESGKTMETFLPAKEYEKMFKLFIVHLEAKAKYNNLLKIERGGEEVVIKTNDEKVSKEWVANKIKEFVKNEGLTWDRRNTNYCNTLNMEVEKIYFAYDVLKGRKTTNKAYGDGKYGEKTITTAEEKNKMVCFEWDNKEKCVKRCTIEDIEKKVKGDKKKAREIWEKLRKLLEKGCYYYQSIRFNTYDEKEIHLIFGINGLERKIANSLFESMVIKKAEDKMMKESKEALKKYGFSFSGIECSDDHYYTIIINAEKEYPMNKVEKIGTLLVKAMQDYMIEEKIEIKIQQMPDINKESVGKDFYGQYNYSFTTNVKDVE